MSIEPTYRANDASELEWTPAATAMLGNVPFFVRSQARARIEALAYAEGENAIDAGLVERARLEFGQ
jgi:hypothetical protein